MESSAYEAGQTFGQALVVILLVAALVGGGIFFIVAMIKSFTRKTRGWIMATVIAGVVALVGLFGSIGLAAKGIAKLAKSAKEAGERTKKLSSKDGSHSIEVPVIWKEMPELNADASIAGGNGLRGQFVLVIRNPKADFEGNLEQFDDLISGEVESNLEKGQRSEAESRTVGGLPTLHRRLTGTTDKINLVYHSSSVETKEAFYQVILWTTPSQESSAAPIFRKIADSFTSTEGAPLPGQKGVSVTEASDVIGKVREIVVDHLGVTPDKVTPQARFVEDLGADSLDAVELVMAVEEEFEISIDDESAAAMATIGDVVNYIEKKQTKVEAE